MREAMNVESLIDEAFGIRGRRHVPEGGQPIQPDDKVLFKRWLRTEAKHGEWNAIDLSCPMSDLLAEPETFVADLFERIRGCQSGKAEATRRVRYFLHYLNETQSVALDLSRFEFCGWINQEDRILTLLRLVHRRDMKREQIAEALGVSLRTVDSDIARLADGFSFLGTVIRVTPEDQFNFGSDVHPLFLALNTGDLFMMTIGMSLMAEGTVFEGRARKLVNQVVAQMSDSARVWCEEQAGRYAVEFGETIRKFENTWEIAV